MEQSDKEYWDIEITPGNNLFDLKLKDTWHYRDLLLLLVKRDFVSFYKQTILGPLWFFVQPIITIILYTFVFGGLAGIPVDNVPHPIFYLAGTIIWSYFSECLTKTSTVFRDNAGMLGKVYFPRLIMPLSIVLSSLLKLTVQFLLFLLLFGYFIIQKAPISPSWYALLFPLLLIMIAAQGLGWGMIISAVTTKYRDLAFVVSFIVPLLMYATSVIYPLSYFHLKFPHYYWLIKYNPITVAIETFRLGFFGKGTFSWAMLGYFFVNTVVILLTGTVIFNRVEKTFVDTV